MGDVWVATYDGYSSYDFVRERDIIELHTSREEVTAVTTNPSARISTLVRSSNNSRWKMPDLPPHFHLELIEHLHDARDRADIGRDKLLSVRALPEGNRWSWQTFTYKEFGTALQEKLWPDMTDQTGPLAEPNSAP